MCLEALLNTHEPGVHAVILMLYVEAGEEKPESEVSLSPGQDVVRVSESTQTLSWLIGFSL